MRSVQPSRRLPIALFHLALFLLCLVFASKQAQADDGAQVSDVVVLHDGSFVRGTLVEHAVNEYAVLLTRGGQLRRFAASEITYAGPASGMPRAPSVQPPVSANAPPPGESVQPAVPVAGRGRIRFLSKERLQVFERTGVSTSLRGVATGESFGPLCTAPCESTLTLGSHVLALALPNQDRPLHAGTLEVRPSTVVEVSYQSRQGLRVGGFLLGLAGYGGGLALMLTDIGSDDGFGAQFWSGAALMGVSTVVWLVMGLVPDVAKLSVQQ